MRKLSAGLFLLLFAAAALADLTVVSPTDKLQTFDEVVDLRGKLTPLAAVWVENISIPVSGAGGFTCGLILRPGKNLINVRSEGEKRSFRLLRLVTYPDIEIKYDGKKHWARSQIIYLATLGVIEGSPDGNFYPGNPVTRGEFATWLAKAKGLTAIKPDKDVLFDVPKEHWRAPYIKAALEKGYLSGYANGLFGIDDPVSRREAAVVSVAVEGLGIIDKITPLFRDVPQEERGAAPIYTAKEGGLVIGVSEKLPVFDPERALTRAEAATLIYRFGDIQSLVNDLSDYGTGYTQADYCQINVLPQISNFSILPTAVRAGETAKIRLRAQIASRKDFVPISKVKADLSVLGGLPDAEMFDDGTAGDETAGDSIFSLNTSFEPKELGEKIIRITAADQIGWEGSAAAKLDVVE